MSLWICFHLLILTATVTVSTALHTEQQQCGVANLTAFGDRRWDVDYLGRPPDDKLQAIVPAYTFNCTGRVTEWRACVDQGGGGERYYTQFQVWRSTAVMGCYRLVGYNGPPEPNFESNGDVNNTDQLLQPSGSCVHLPVSEDEQIQFQPSDVIGYYADRFHDNGDDYNIGGGAQVVSDQDVVVYHRIDVPLSELQTKYAIPALGPDPSSCGFEFNGSDSNLFQMTSTTSGAPIISLDLTAVVTTEIQSNGILFSTATLPTLKPTSSLTTTIIGSSPESSCSGGCSGSTHPPNSLTVIVGVASALVVVITAAVIIITVLVCLRRRNKGPDLVDNVAYISGTREEHENMMHPEGDVHIFTSTNEAYDTAKVSGEATDVFMSTNPAYQVTQCQGGRGSFIYDYPRPD